ncbi:Hypothetical protein, putative [Bodo saltans]|uniref:Uncharacterized protein n=1 Tax=Bodo saltans TaxID=75058 RepID=A0A0S4IS22_BODSA|nr:Hypothetical protein, putative [Bodo saltans]|eukprot:CUE78643.1 Hypothetical protein, putative [Bodo saltans]
MTPLNGLIPEFSHIRCRADEARDEGAKRVGILQMERDVELALGMCLRGKASSRERPFCRTKRALGGSTNSSTARGLLPQSAWFLLKVLVCGSGLRSDLPFFSHYGCRHIFLFTFGLVSLSYMFWKISFLLESDPFFPSLLDAARTLS